MPTRRSTVDGGEGEGEPKLGTEPSALQRPATPRLQGRPISVDETSMAVTSRTSFYSASNPAVQIARALVVAGGVVASAVLLGYALDIPSGFGESGVPDGLRHPHWALLGIYGGAVVAAAIMRAVIGRRRYLTFLPMLVVVVVAAGIAAGSASVIDRRPIPFHLSACASPTSCESLAATRGQGHLLTPTPDSALLSFQHGSVFTGPPGLIHVGETFRSLGAEGPAQVQVGIASRQELNASEFCSLPRWHQATAATGITYCYVVNPCSALAMFSVGPATYSVDVNDSAACPTTFRTVEPNRIRTVIGSFQ
jgi:hypothetical protein